MLVNPNDKMVRKVVGKFLKKNNHSKSHTFTTCMLRIKPYTVLQFMQIKYVKVDIVTDIQTIVL